MKVTKLGHCCLLIEEKKVRILTDPGIYSTGQNTVKNIDAILITHEHADHFHIPSLKECLKNNPEAQVITNKAVSRLLKQEKIKHQIVQHGKSIAIKNVTIEGLGEKHAPMYKTIPLIQNTGYFINEKLFYPGDALYNPLRPVPILALPVAGPWLKLSEAIDYALEVKPEKCFPVHEGLLKTPGSVHRIPSEVLPKHKIKFIVLDENREYRL